MPQTRNRKWQSGESFPCQEHQIEWESLQRKRWESGLTTQHTPEKNVAEPSNHSAIEIFTAKKREGKKTQICSSIPSVDHRPFLALKIGPGSRPRRVQTLQRRTRTQSLNGMDTCEVQLCAGLQCTPHAWLRDKMTLCFIMHIVSWLLQVSSLG